MSDMSIDTVLTQMRAMSSEASNSTVNIENNGEDFSALLKHSINQLNETQHTSARMTKEFETGESDASLAEVMVALQKSSISFQAAVQVRNKLTDAYREVMNMPM